MTSAAYRQFAVVFLCTAGLLGATVASFNFIIDPLQRYRISTLYKPVFWVGMQRYQVASLARLYAEPVVVVGQSTTENFLPSYIEKSWGKPASKLSISASTAHEQHLALRLALQTGRVTDVLWGAEQDAFTGPPERMNQSQAPFPLYMYQTGPVAAAAYLLSLGTTRLSVMILTGNALSSALDDYHTWHHRFVFSREAVLASWRGNCGQFTAKYDAQRDSVGPRLAAEMAASIERNILSLARDYPQVTFHLFYPPYSLLNYIPADGYVLAATLALRTALAAQTAALPNIRMYDFQIEEPIVANLANYKDAFHFGLSTSEYVIDAVRSGRHLVSAADLRHNNQSLIALVNGFDLCRDGALAG